MRLGISGEATDGIVVASVELAPDTGTEPWELGELKFTLDEWTEFISYFSSHENGTVIGFDISTTDGERVLL